MSTEVASLPPVGLLYNGFYFGAMMSTALYGITCMQTFFYYVHYRNDSKHMKIFVAVLWALNTIHEALSISGVYKYFISGFVTPSSVVDWNPELTLLLLFTATVAVPVQGFFVYRIYIFSGKNIIAPFLWVPLAIVHLGSAIIYAGKALYTVNGVVYNVHIAVQSDHTFATLAYVCLSVAAVVDTLIAIVLTFLLVRKRASTSFARSGHILQGLILFSVNTGIWTAIFALATIILLHVWPSNMLYALPGISLCAVYCNTILANLNARAYLGDGKMTNAIDVNLFISSGSQPESTKTNKQYRPGEAKLASSAQQEIWKAREVAMFLDANRLSPMTFKSENTFELDNI